METLSIDIGHGQHRTVTVAPGEARRIEKTAARIAAMPEGASLSAADYYSVVGTPRYEALASLSTQERAAGPDRVTIPGLHASLPIHTAGISAMGQMEVAGGVKQISWLDTTADPNAPTGSTLLAFHRDTGEGGRGVWSPFFHVRNLGVGARIDVTWHGRTTAYRIVRFENVPKNSLPSEIFNPAGKRQIVLITCGGPLVKHKDGLLHWSTRLLTFATPA